MHRFLVIEAKRLLPLLFLLVLLVSLSIYDNFFREYPVVAPEDELENAVTFVTADQGMLSVPASFQVIDSTEDWNRFEEEYTALPDYPFNPAYEYAISALNGEIKSVQVFPQEDGIIQVQVKVVEQPNSYHLVTIEREKIGEAARWLFLDDNDRILQEILLPGEEGEPQESAGPAESATDDSRLRGGRVEILFNQGGQFRQSAPVMGGQCGLAAVDDLSFDEKSGHADPGGAHILHRVIAGHEAALRGDGNHLGDLGIVFGAGLAVVHVFDGRDEVKGGSGDPAPGEPFHHGAAREDGLGGQHQLQPPAPCRFQHFAGMGTGGAPGAEAGKLLPVESLDERIDLPALHFQAAAKFLVEDSFVGPAGIVAFQHGLDGGKKVRGKLLPGESGGEVCGQRLHVRRDKAKQVQLEQGAVQVQKQGVEAAPSRFRSRIRLFLHFHFHFHLQRPCSAAASVRGL